MKEIRWRLRYLFTLLAAGGWRDIRTCLYLTKCADWENGDADPAATAREEMGYMASDIG